MTFRNRTISFFPNKAMHRLASPIDPYIYIALKVDAGSFPYGVIGSPVPFDKACATTQATTGLPTVNATPRPSQKALSTQPCISFTLAFLHLFAGFRRYGVSEVGLAVSFTSFSRVMTSLHGIAHSLSDFGLRPLPKGSLAQLLTCCSRTTHFMFHYN